jgi:hypothetical protein
MRETEYACIIFREREHLKNPEKIFGKCAVKMNIQDTVPSNNNLTYYSVGGGGGGLLLHSPNIFLTL